MEDEPKERHNNIYRSKKQMMLNNFLGGIAWSFGTLVGAAIIVGLIGFILSKIDLVPIIGSWVSQIIQEAGPKSSVLIPK